MNKPQKLRSWPVQSYGLQALNALRASHGQVIAVFKRSFYLQSTNGLACLGTTGLGAGPLNILVELPPNMNWHASGLRKNTPTIRVESCLHVGFYRFFIGSGVLWQPPAKIPPKPLLLQRGLQTLKDRLPHYAESPPGLGRLIPALLDGALPMPMVPMSILADDPSMQALIRAGNSLISWVTQEGKKPPSAPQTFDHKIPDNVSDLLGMGPGLTPSGDDFIAGVLIALRYLNQNRQADNLANELLKKAKSCTNLISYHHLLAAAQGQASATIHDLLIALCNGQDRLDDELDAVAAIGHSSGWDTLAGMISVLAQQQERSIAYQTASNPPANSAA